MKLLLLSIILLGLGFAGIAIKIWAKKGLYAAVATKVDVVLI